MIGPWTTSDRQIYELERLAEDLEAYSVGELPKEREFWNAPLIDAWSLISRPAACLAGFCDNHPTAAAGPLVTSELFWLDENHRFARTRSRIYRLGSRLGTQ